MIAKVCILLAVVAAAHASAVIGIGAPLLGAGHLGTVSAQSTAINHIAPAGIAIGHGIAAAPLGLGLGRAGLGLGLGGIGLNGVGLGGIGLGGVGLGRVGVVGLGGAGLGKGIW